MVSRAQLFFLVLSPLLIGGFLGFPEKCVGQTSASYTSLAPWQTLSLDASSAFHKRELDKAVDLIDQAIECAVTARVSPYDLAALNCKRAEILGATGKNEEAIASARKNRARLNRNDWRQTLLLCRNLQVEWYSCMATRDLKGALQAALEMDDISVKMWGADSPEHLLRKCRLVETYFFLKEYDKVIEIAAPLKVLWSGDGAKRTVSSEVTHLLVYLGLCQIYRGREQEGEKLLNEALECAKELNNHYASAYLGMLISGAKVDGEIKDDLMIIGIKFSEMGK